MPCDCPRTRRRFAGQGSDIGFIKTTFFSNFGYHKPAVTIFVFDFREIKEGEIWDWPQIEATVLAQIKNHSDHWNKEASVPSKYVTIFLFPTGNLNVNIEECRKSYT